MRVSIPHGGGKGKPRRGADPPENGGENARKGRRILGKLYKKSMRESGPIPGNTENKREKDAKKEEPETIAVW